MQNHSAHNPSNAADIQFFMTLLAQMEMQSVDKARPPDRDAQPDPEPAAPSLPAPDPGVFHHDPPPIPTKPTPKDKHA